MTAEAWRAIVPHIGLTRAFDVDMLFKTRRAGYAIRKFRRRGATSAAPSSGSDSCRSRCCRHLPAAPAVFPLRWVVICRPAGRDRTGPGTHENPFFGQDEAGLFRHGTIMVVATFAARCSMRCFMVIGRTLPNAEYGARSPCMVWCWSRAPGLAMQNTLAHFTSNCCWPVGGGRRNLFWHW